MSRIKFYQLTLLLLFVASQHGVAQYQGFTAVGNTEEFKKKFSEEGRKILSIHSSFTQEKNLSMLEEKIVSEGKFWYEREKKVRLEYQKPFRYLLIMKDDQILIKDDQKESRVSTHSNKLFQQINRIIVDCVNGEILSNKDFSSHVFQNDKEFLLEMTPVSKSMKDFFQTIVVRIEKRDVSVASIELHEQGGDNTIIRFSDKVLNEKLNDALFVR